VTLPTDFSQLSEKPLTRQGAFTSPGNRGKSGTWISYAMRDVTGRWTSGGKCDTTLFPKLWKRVYERDKCSIPDRTSRFQTHLYDVAERGCHPRRQPYMMVYRHICMSLGNILEVVSVYVISVSFYQGRTFSQSPNMQLQSFIITDVFAVLAARALDTRLTTDYVCGGSDSLIITCCDHTPASAHLLCRSELRDRGSSSS